MALREIITIPNPILRKKARKVNDFGKDFQELVADMIDTMRDAPGVGLAAPQVAESQRLIVVEFGDEEDEEKPKKLFVVANPEIISASDEMVMGIEGCLSVPELVGEVDRHESIVVKGLNRFGKPTKIKASGWLARIFQHEMDHLDGVLYPDRAARVWKPAPDEEIPLD
ncbi:MAG TPA: peptide deformylase [Anaerolineaceae bacterium]|nr:peptide deformylase [Anaerolineaceae bacterium]